MSIYADMLTAAVHSKDRVCSMCAHPLSRLHQNGYPPQLLPFDTDKQGLGGKQQYDMSTHPCDIPVIDKV